MSGDFKCEADGVNVLAFYDKDDAPYVIEAVNARSLLPRGTLVKVQEECNKHNMQLRDGDKGNRQVHLSHLVVDEAEMKCDWQSEVRKSSLILIYCSHNLFRHARETVLPFIRNAEAKEKKKVLLLNLGRVKSDHEFCHNDILEWLRQKQKLNGDEANRNRTIKDIYGKGDGESEWEDVRNSLLVEIMKTIMDIIKMGACEGGDKDGEGEENDATGSPEGPAVSEYRLGNKVAFSGFLLLGGVTVFVVWSVRRYSAGFGDEAVAETISSFLFSSCVLVGIPVVIIFMLLSRRGR